MARNGDMESLRLFDYTDRELLIVVMEAADDDEDGFAPTLEIADRLGMVGKHRLNAVGSRLAAMRRIGAVDKMPDSVISRWSVSDIGRSMATGKMRKTAERALDSLGAEQMILLTRFLTARYRDVPEAASHLMRREWQAGTRRVS